MVNIEALAQELTSTSVVPVQRMRSIFEGMSDGVWLVTADGRTTYVNGSMTRLLGSTSDEMRGRRITDYLEEPSRSEVEAFLARQSTGDGEEIDLRFRRGDRSDLFGHVAASPITTPEGIYVGAMLLVADLTEEHRGDGLGTQAQRLEAVGLFAGGIVHDFNNMLTAILGYTELARTHLPEGHPVRVDLDQVMASAERASAITRKLLAFTRRQILTPVNIDPAQVVDDLIPILRPLMGGDVHIELDAHSKHGWVRIDPTEIEQIVVNLLVNARDAMPAGGTVTIAVKDTKSSKSDLPDPDQSRGRFVRISVSDTGTGMDEATKARIFDPFYTTKSLGKGTGLGLATVLGIVNQYGGHIGVETSPGKGSTFSVDLPRVALVALPDPKDLAGVTPRPSGVVLVVENDSAVREFVRRSLEGAGYTVLAAAGGDQAMLASEGWGDWIDVLLTDIVMDGIQGPELAARMSARRPGIGVVFMSGYGGDAVGDTAELNAAAVFLPKPFSVEALSRAVGRAADVARRGPN